MDLSDHRRRGSHSHNRCTILHQFVKRQEELVEEKSERYVRSVLEYRTREALEKIPEWALKLYKRHKLLEWDIIALNPSQEFWTWLEKEHKGQVTNWAHLMENLKMRGCTPENIFRKLHCRGISTRAIQEALEDGDVSQLRYRMGGLTVKETKALSLALGWKLGVSDFSNKLALYEQYQQVLDSYGSITKEQYNSWMKEGGTWGTTCWGHERSSINWEKNALGVFEPVYQKEVFEPDEEQKRLVWAQKHFRDLLHKDIFQKMFPGEKIENTLTSNPWWLRLWRFTKGKSHWTSGLLDNDLTQQMLELLDSLGIEYTVSEQTKYVKEMHLHIKDLGNLGSEMWYKLMLLSK